MMKKITLLTLCLFIIFSAGCGKDEYTTEREYWYVQKEAEKIFKNPHASPPQELKNAVASLNSFISHNPKSQLATTAEFTISRLYMVKDEYENARNQLNSILEKYKQSDLIYAEALFLLGNSYQLQDNWKQALIYYKKIIQDYPLTPKGLQTPIYIAKYYKIKYQPDKMIAAYREAANHYASLAKQYPDSRFGLASYDLAAKCYMEIRDWEKAISIYDTVLENYRDKIQPEDILMGTALIYKNELKNTQKAKEILEKIIKDYPENELAKKASELLKEMGQDDQNSDTQQ
jgi:TolA-binding protein